MPAKLRAAVTGVSHWHARYDAAYLRLLQNLDVSIVGVSDPSLDFARSVANEFDTRPFDDHNELIGSTSPDFVIALGRHTDMPQIFVDLVGQAVPFMMEKPWGTSAAQVEDLANLAAERGTWAAVPLMMRYTHWAQTARSLIAKGEMGALSHLSIRIIRPTPQRYVEWGSPWMLSAAEAGGGALRNLGAHGFDACFFLTGEEPEVVAAATSSVVYGLDGDEYALVVLRTPSGLVFTNEVGYTVPTWPRNGTDGEQRLAGERVLVRSDPNGVRIVSGDGETLLPQSPDFGTPYHNVVVDTLDCLRRGDPPPCGPVDCVRVARLTDAAYRLAKA